MATRRERVVLASKVGVHHYIDSPRVTVDTILRGTETVLTLAREFDIPLVIASTSEVYGSHPHDPVLFTEASGARRPPGEV